jgi:hypothetical protein
MWRTTLTATFLCISSISVGVAKEPTLLLGCLMADPSESIPRAPIGHHQPTPGDVVGQKPADNCSVGGNVRGSDADQQTDFIDREIMEENKEVDRKIGGICRGC